MNGDDISKVTDSASNFINGAEAWGAMSLSVYITLFLAGVVTIILFVVNKNSNNWTKILMDLQKDSNTSIQNNTNVIGHVLDAFKENRAILQATMEKMIKTDSKIDFNSETIKEIQENTEKTLLNTEKLLDLLAIPHGLKKD